MSRDRNLLIKIEGDSKELQEEFDKIKKETKDLQKNLTAIAKTSAVAFAGLTAAVVGVTAAFREDEQAQIRTIQTLEATGNAAGVTAQEMFDLSQSLQDVTTFSDAAVLEGQNLLLTFRNIGGETLPRATEALLDMSTAMKTGVKESAIQLGKALNDPVAGISALTRVGITFSDEQKNTIKALDAVGDRAGAQAIILKELEMQFGGVSRAAATGTGVFIQLQNVLGNILSAIGENVFTVIQPFTQTLLDFFKGVRDNNPTLVKFLSNLLIAGTVVAGLSTAVATLGLGVLALTTATGALGISFTAAWAAATGGLALIIPGVILLVEKMGGLDQIIRNQVAGWEFFKQSISQTLDDVIINVTRLSAKFFDLQASIASLIPGNEGAAESFRKTAESLRAEADRIIEKNIETRQSFEQILGGLNAEAAAQKVREQEEAMFNERVAAEQRNIERRKIDEENRLAAQQESDLRFQEQLAASEAIKSEIIAAENALRELERGRFNNKEIVETKKKIADLEKIRSKNFTDEQKATAKHQKDLRDAEAKDQEQRLESDRKFRSDLLVSINEFGSAVLKQGSGLAKALFLITKAAALADIIVNTQRAAALAIATIPPPFGEAVAAQRIALGAVQGATVAATAITGLENGGLVGPIGASRSGDRHPAMLADGELVVPRRNFEEVVSAFAKQRGFTESSDSPGEGSATRVEISFTDEAAEFITAQQFENTTLGTDRG